MAAETPSGTQEALQFWGYLFQDDRTGTDLFRRLLKGIARYISTNVEPSDTKDITPSQLAAFYRSVDGDCDMLFCKTPPSSLAFLYKSLGCLHSLQPKPEDDGFTSPSVPALKHSGYLTWQTIQLLLGPDEHVPFLQNAVSRFDIVDPQTGQTFPKILPREAFPTQPDAEMTQWSNGVQERLRKEAEGEEARNAAKDRDDMSVDSSADERAYAPNYIRDPLYRDRGARPTVVRHIIRETRRASKSPKDPMHERVATAVRHLKNPFSHKRREDDIDYEDNSPPPATRRYHPRPRVSRKDSFTSSESDSEGPVGSPILRHRRSHEVPPSPRDYFPPPYNHDYSRRHSEEPRIPKPATPEFGPSNGQLFATTVAQLQPQGHHARPTLSPRGSTQGTAYAAGSRRPSMQYSSPRGSYMGTPPPGFREGPERASYGSYPPSRRTSRDHDRYRGMERERDSRPRVHRYVTPVDGVGGRKYPMEAPYR